MARLTMGVVGLAAAPVEPAAAAAGDWTEVACWVVLYSGACQARKPAPSRSPRAVPPSGRSEAGAVRRGCRAAVRHLVEHRASCFARRDKGGLRRDEGFPFAERSTIASGPASAFRSALRGAESAVRRAGRSAAGSGGCRARSEPSVRDGGSGRGTSAVSIRRAVALRGEAHAGMQVVARRGGERDQHPIRQRPGRRGGADPFHPRSTIWKSTRHTCKNSNIRSIQQEGSDGLKLSRVKVDGWLRPALRQPAAFRQMLQCKAGLRIGREERLDGEFRQRHVDGRAEDRGGAEGSARPPPS